MPHLYLPAEHTDADLVLAGAIAEAIGSAELHIAWTERGGAGVPEIGAVMREPVNPWREIVSLLGQVVRELGRMVLRRRRPVRTTPAAPELTGFIVTWTPEAPRHDAGEAPAQ
jgi:hypothetical protein